MKAAGELSRHRFTSGQFERMVETGVLNKYDRVELIDGEVIELAPIGPMHAEVVARLADALYRQVKDRARIRIQSPLHLSELSSPEPDIAVVVPGSYESRHPGPQDSLLIIEVADTSLAYKRTVKLPAYAASGVPEVWLIDLNRNLVEIYRNPQNGQFADFVTATGSESIALKGLPEMEIDLRAIL